LSVIIRRRFYSFFIIALIFVVSEITLNRLSVPRFLYFISFVLGIVLEKLAAGDEADKRIAFSILGAAVGVLIGISLWLFKVIPALLTVDPGRTVAVAAVSFGLGGGSIPELHGASGNSFP
jgi:hypothetical protein